MFTYQNCGKMDAVSGSKVIYSCGVALPEYAISFSYSGQQDIMANGEITYPGPMQLSVRDSDGGFYPGIAKWSIYKGTELISTANQNGIDFILQASNVCEHYLVTAEFDVNGCEDEVFAFNPTLRVRTTSCDSVVTPSPTPRVSPTPTPVQERYISVMEVPSVSDCNSKEAEYNQSCQALGFQRMKYCYPRDPELRPSDYGYNGLWAGYLCSNN